MKKKLLVILILALISISLIDAKHYKYSSNSYKSGVSCSTQEGCKDLNNRCKCFCAFKEAKGGYRDKLSKQDHPIFLQGEEDKFGKTCYCAARDIKVLEEVAAGMPIYKAREKYKNYNTPSEKSKKRVAAFKS